MKIKKTFFGKSMITVLLVSFLIFSMFSTCTLIVLAEKSDPAIGKFLTIDFTKSAAGIANSGCSVRVTKTSGVTVDFSTNPGLDDLEQVIEQRVGAGTVFLEAIAGDGWIFDQWSSNVETNSLEPDTGYYKTEKLGVVDAVFVRETYKINTTVFGGVGGTINGTIEFEWTVEAGDTPTFVIHPTTDNPEHDYDISLIQVRDLTTNTSDFYPSADSYKFDPVFENYELIVYFSEDGKAFIPLEASNVPISLGNEVSLEFESLETTGDTGGTATQFEIVSVDGFLVGNSSLILWNIILEGVKFAENATVALPYSGDTNITHVYTSDDLKALYCDVNGDGEVTNADVNEVAIALATSGREYNAAYDVNMDLVLDSADIQLVHDYIGTQLEELSWTYDPDLNILYIETGHFSIFRGR